MNEFFASVPNIGELYYYHVYLFYDEPQLFSCVTKTLQYYFFTTIPCEDDERSWLAVPISTGKLAMLEKNSLEIRTAFIDPESILWKIQCQDQHFSSMLCLPASLTDEMLPERGELLDYPNEMELLPSEETPAEQSQREMRDVIELSLEKDNQHISELPCTVLSDVLETLQQLVFAIGYKEGGLSGPIPRTIKENHTLCVTGMFAASVGIRFKSNELSDILGETPLTEALTELNHLFSCMDDRVAIREFISTHNPRVAVKYRTFLKTMVKHNTGFKINNASPNKYSYTHRFSTKQLAANLEMINSEINEIVESKTLYGKIVGINVERDTFEFITADDERIRGNLAAAMEGCVFSVPQVVEADFEIRIGTDSFTQEEKLLYSLVSIKPIVEEGL